MNLTFTWLRFWCTERAGFHEKTTTEWEETGGKCTGNSEGRRNDMNKPLLRICLFAISQPKLLRVLKLCTRNFCKNCNSHISYCKPNIEKSHREQVNG